eukprot:TRINITY_DN16850_c0_g1_i1.p1 TRINITY_DN16850_c0_g1~~TRINITY_DN16850_c0_g1_i1.p1  ORF type:complete len:147 (+),score=24.47 TRINITY_DN16850_c0_g1_i1:50-490(+)
MSISTLPFFTFHHHSPVVAPRPIHPRMESSNDLLEPYILGEASEELQNILQHSSDFFSYEDSFSPIVEEESWRSFGVYSPDSHQYAEDQHLFSPPLRAHNPITLNSPFSCDDPFCTEGAELGLFNTSPPHSPLNMTRKQNMVIVRA